jgi:RimJ/RimL family protein N-acetyltransferase
MARVQLVRLDPALEATLANDATYQQAMVQGDWALVANRVHHLVGRTIRTHAASVDELAWSGYFAVDEETREVVGSCAFKAPPTQDCIVEIAYFTYPGFEGRGYATAMARRLIESAKRSGAIREVIAHTLPEKNASTRVLEKAGMSFTGEVIDPDDGSVWRWCVKFEGFHRPISL